MHGNMNVKQQDTIQVLCAVNPFSKTEGFTNARLRVNRATKFCTVAANICGSLVWNLLVTVLAPRILRWLLDIWKIYATLC